MPQVSLINHHPRKKLPTQRLRKLAERLSTGFDFRGVEISFLFTTNRGIQRIHKQFMNDPSTTDVITFVEKKSIDAVISLDQAGTQARKRGLSLFHEVALLLCHALLHAKGFDDLTEKKALVMRQQEFEWMARLL